MFTAPPTFAQPQPRRPADPAARTVAAEQRTAPDLPLTGEVVDAAAPSHPEVEAKAPPSSYAVADFLDGTGGSGMRLAGLTLLRAGLIAPGLWVASKVASVPLSFGQVVGFSLASSATITGGMVGLYAARRRWPPQQRSV